MAVRVDSEDSKNYNYKGAAGRAPEESVGAQGMQTRKSRELHEVLWAKSGGCTVPVILFFVINPNGALGLF